MGRLRRSGYVWVSTAVAAGMVLLATVKGPGLSSDSVEYLATGINLADSGELTTLDGEPFTLYPPGLPIVVAVGEEVGLGARSTVRWLTAGCAAAIVVLGYLLMRRVPMRASVLAGATILLGVSSAVLNVAKMAWTEAPFIVVTLLFLLVLGSVWRAGRVTGLQVAALVGLCWAAFFLRYAGVSLVVAGVVVVATALWPLDRRRASQVAAFTGLALAAPVAWALRNHAADGTWLGPRVRSTDTIAEVGRRIIGGVGRWFLPMGSVDHPVLVALGAVVIVAVAVAAAKAVGVGERAGGSSSPSAPAGRELAVGIGPSVVFVVVYVAYLAVAQLTSAIDPIDARLLSPAFVPFVVVTAVALDTALGRLETSRLATPSLIAAAIAVVGGMFLFGQLVASARLVRTAAASGIGYSSESWQRSALARATGDVARHDDVEVVTNEQFGLWAAAEMPRIRIGPKAVAIRDVAAEGELDGFARMVACNGSQVVLAMFDLDRFEEYDVRVYPTRTIAQAVDLSVRASFDDGVLYDVAPKPGTQPRCG